MSKQTGSAHIFRFPFWMVFWGIPLFLAAQDETRTFRRIFSEAESVLLYLHDHEKALPLYLILNDMDKENAHIMYKIGLCYLNIPGKKSEAIQWFRKAAENISRNFVPVYDERKAPPEAWFYLARAYHVTNRLEEAIETYQVYAGEAGPTDYYDMAFVQQQVEGCRLALEMQEDPVPVQETLLPETINAYTENFNPALSGNGMHLVYMARSGEENRIIYSQRKGGTWAEGRDITPELGDPGMMVISSLSFQGNRLVVFRDDQGKADLYVSYRNGNHWSPLEKMNRNINTRYWEGNGCFSPDGNTFVFSSNRKGGLGGLDLYCSEKNEKGEWGPASSLGKTVNTPLMDDAPYFSADGSRLYFSSQGHHAMGGYDLFFTERTREGTWSRPVNLGYPVNTTDDDLFIAPAGNGDTALYARFTGEGMVYKGIYRIVLRAEEPAAILKLAGVLRLADGNLGKTSGWSVEVTDTLTGETVVEVPPDTASGRFSLDLSPGVYRVTCRAAGYATTSQVLAVKGDIGSRTLIMNTTLYPDAVASGEYHLLHNTYFDFNEHRLNAGEKRKLDRIAATLLEYPELKFELTGYADPQGNARYNLGLSDRRAQAVAEYLLHQGVNPERMIVRGVGEIAAVPASPLRPGNLQKDGNALMRKVAVRIIRTGEEQVIPEEISIPEYLQGPYALRYSVIVIRVDEPLSPDYFSRFSMDELRYIRELKAKDGYIYTLGSYAEKPRAIRTLGELFRLGFTEAVVVDQHELEEMVLDALEHESLLGRPPKITEVPWYTIQIYALKNTPPENAFRGLDNIMVFRGDDGFTRYTTGKYQGYLKAREALEGIYGKGYPESFVRLLEPLYRGRNDDPQ